tara:strand:+ start:401 stop:694 length:294 start_codon:yes stop_codon:yes gene_type:complete
LLFSTVQISVAVLIHQGALRLIGTKPKSFPDGVSGAFDFLEEQRFIDLGCEIRRVAAGACARVKIRDWRSKLDQPGPTFGALIDEYGYDSSRPQMEF